TYGRGRLWVDGGGGGEGGTDEVGVVGPVVERLVGEEPDERADDDGDEDEHGDLDHRRGRVGTLRVGGSGLLHPLPQRPAARQRDLGGVRGRTGDAADRDPLWPQREDRFLLGLAGSPVEVTGRVAQRGVLRRRAIAGGAGGPRGVGGVGGLRRGRAGVRGGSSGRRRTGDGAVRRTPTRLRCTGSSGRRRTRGAAVHRTPSTGRWVGGG